MQASRLCYGTNNQSKYSSSPSDKHTLKNEKPFLFLGKQTPPAAQSNGETGLALRLLNKESPYTTPYLVEGASPAKTLRDRDPKARSLAF